jgi:hypothetical protein
MSKKIREADYFVRKLNQVAINRVGVTPDPEAFQILLGGTQIEGVSTCKHGCLILKRLAGDFQRDHPKPKRIWTRFA